LVRALLLNKQQTQAFVEVTFGTSQRKEDERPLDLHICNATEMAEAGLPQATCFVMDKTATIPWCSEFFTKREDGTGPVVGHLPQTAIMQLESLKVIRRKYGAK
jgi:hypothetical protein